jgi:hypothetical protein
MARSGQPRWAERNCNLGLGGMFAGSEYVLSRRGALAGLAAACGGAFLNPIAIAAAAEDATGPVFSPSGPDPAG